MFLDQPPDVVAQMLDAKGYKQISRKYRTIAALDDDFLSWPGFSRKCANYYRRVLSTRQITNVDEAVMMHLRRLGAVANGHSDD